MLAEIDDQLTAFAPVRALHQLDAREARGERLDVVCAVALRAQIQAQIDALALSGTRRKVLELKALIGRQAMPASIAAQASERRQVLAEKNAKADQVIAASEIVVAPDDEIALPADVGLTANSDVATADGVRVVDLMSYRAAGQAAQAERAVAQSPRMPRESKVPLWLEAARPKARIRVPARTCQVLASTALALAFWINLPPVAVGPSPLMAVQMAAARLGEVAQVGSTIEAWRQTDVAAVLYSR